jgi:hypothetical protein
MIAVMVRTRASRLLWRGGVATSHQRTLMG